MRKHPFFFGFALVLILLYGGYFWSAYTGYRWLGDDNQSTASHRGYRSGTSHFFHK